MTFLDVSGTRRRQPVHDAATARAMIAATGGRRAEELSAGPNCEPTVRIRAVLRSAAKVVEHALRRTVLGPDHLEDGTEAVYAAVVRAADARTAARLDQPGVRMCAVAAVEVEVDALAVAAGDRPEFEHRPQSGSPAVDRRAEDRAVVARQQRPRRIAAVRTAQKAVQDRCGRAARGPREEQCSARNERANQPGTGHRWFLSSGED